MSEIPDMQELVREVTREQLSHNGLSATHPMLYVSVSDAKQLLDMCREQQAEIERLRKATQVIENIRNFAQNVRGYVYLHNNGREIRYIDDLSLALLNLLEGKDILSE